MSSSQNGGHILVSWFRTALCAYHPQTDAKCECTHFSVHDMITKLVSKKHDGWLGLLGTVALAYNSTVYWTHVTAPTLDPAGSADIYSLQVQE